MLRARTILAESLAALFAVLSLAPTHSASPPVVDYERSDLYELIGYADRIAAGTIRALDDETFEFAVERWIAGEPRSAELVIRRFKDWTCARRWEEYRVGQRLLVFLVPRSDGSIAALGAANEGEMPWNDGTVQLRGYEVPGYPSEALNVDQGSERTSSVPLEDMAAACVAFRDAIQLRRDDPRHPGRWAFDSELSLDDLDARMNASPITRALWRELYCDPQWVGPVRGDRFEMPANVVRLTENALFELSGTKPPSGGKTNNLKYIGYPCFGAALAFMERSQASGPISLAITVPGRMFPSGQRGGVWRVELDASGANHAATLLPPPEGLPEAEEFRGPEYGESLVTLSGLSRVLVGAPRSVHRHVGTLWADTLDPDRAAHAPHDLCVESPLAELAKMDRAVDFGGAAADLGDLDGDGLIEVALFARLMQGDDTFSRAAQVYVVSLDAEAHVRWAGRLLASGSSTELAGGTPALTTLGDVDGDGVTDIALGCNQFLGEDDDRGFVWIGLLNRDKTLKRSVRITQGEGGFDGRLTDGAEFGSCVAGAGDVDRDGVVDLLATSSEGLWVLFLDREARVRKHALVLAPPETIGDRGTGALAVLAPRDHAELVRIAWTVAPISEWAFVSLLRLAPDGSPAPW